MSDCINGLEHDFDSCEESEYCFNGCGEKWATYTIKKLQAENEKLKLEVKHGCVYCHLHDCRELEKLQTENEKLIKCVEFYADVHNWKSGFSLKVDDTKLTNTNQLRRGGKRARQCLQELKEGNE